MLEHESDKPNQQEKNKKLVKLATQTEITDNDVEEFISLLESGASPFARYYFVPWQSRDIFYQVACNGHLRLVQILIEHRKSAQKEDSFDDNIAYALNEATKEGHFDTVKYLFSLKDRNGNHYKIRKAPFVIAASNNHTKIIELLITSPDKLYYRPFAEQALNQVGLLAGGKPDRKLVESLECFIKEIDLTQLSNNSSSFWGRATSSGTSTNTNDYSYCTIQ